MTDNPLSSSFQLQFAGDNFLRFSGDATNIQKLQMFAWQSASRGNDVHMNANPTQGELLHKEFLDKKETLKDTSKVSILAKYGGEEHLEKVPKELLLGQTEDCKCLSCWFYFRPLIQLYHRRRVFPYRSCHSWSRACNRKVEIRRRW